MSQLFWGSVQSQLIPAAGPECWAGRPCIPTTCSADKEKHSTWSVPTAGPFRAFTLVNASDYICKGYVLILVPNMGGTSETSSLMVLKSNQAPQARGVLIMDGFLSSTKEISMYRKEVKKKILFF